MLQMHLPHLLLSIWYSEAIVYTHICWDLTVTSFQSWIILIFSHISERILKIQSNWRYLCIYLYIALRKSQYSGNSLALVYFSCRLQQGSLLLSTNIPNIHFIQTSVPHHGREYPKYSGKSPKRSREMAKSATSVQENWEFLGSDCKC